LNPSSSPAKVLHETDKLRKAEERDGLSLLQPEELRDLSRRVAMDGASWVGVDLDNTLAEYDGYKGPTVIGEPRPNMMRVVKRHLANGDTVKIFTARVADDPNGTAKRAIEAWCLKHVGKFSQSHV